jgi:hypothetical protein
MSAKRVYVSNIPVDAAPDEVSQVLVDAGISILDVYLFTRPGVTTRTAWVTVASGKDRDLALQHDRRVELRGRLLWINLDYQQPVLAQLSRGRAQEATLR